MTKLEQKLTRLARMKREVAALEREVKQLAAAEIHATGRGAIPHIDVLMRRVAA